MIKSMTGYGSAKGSVEGLEISVELKSVNNRFLDCSVRMPRSFLFAEDAVKSAVQKHISRGKVDVFVSMDSSQAGDMTVKVNEALLKGYMDAIRHIADEYSLPNDLSAVTVAMLRSQGVPAKLMIGSRKNGYHSWVVLILNGEEKRFDPTAELEGKKYTKTDYTIERYY